MSVEATDSADPRPARNMETTMSVSYTPARRRTAGLLFLGALGAGTIGASASPAQAATTVTASFGAGVLTVVGDAQSNTITISRDAAGAIKVNGGAVSVSGGTPTVANTSSVSVLAQGGDDTVSLDEANGALPTANLF